MHVYLRDNEVYVRENRITKKINKATSTMKFGIFFYISSIITPVFIELQAFAITQFLRDYPGSNQHWFFSKSHKTSNFSRLLRGFVSELPPRHSINKNRLRIQLDSTMSLLELNKHDIIHNIKLAHGGGHYYTGSDILTDL